MTHGTAPVMFSSQNVSAIHDLVLVVIVIVIHISNDIGNINGNVSNTSDISNNILNHGKKTVSTIMNNGCNSNTNSELLTSISKELIRML